MDLIEGDADVSGQSPANPFPLLRCDKSIYVLPGVPHLLVHQFALLRATLAKGEAHGSRIPRPERCEPV